MSFTNISNLRSSIVESCSYFLDANIWIYSLQRFEDLANWQASYYNFFYDIVDSSLSPKPKIVLPSLLLSEIINTFLKQIALPEYRLLYSIPSNVVTNFKKDYRPTQHCKDSFERIMDDIVSIKSSIEFLNDSAIVNEAYLFDKNISDFDYNDYSVLLSL